jgi:hypothetical protein
MSYGVTPQCLLWGEAVGLAAQNMGRTGPIPPASGGISWSSLLGITLLWAVISTIVAVESANRGMRRRAWGWTASFLVSALVAAYSFWMM